MSINKNRKKIFKRFSLFCFVLVLFLLVFQTSVYALVHFVTSISSGPYVVYFPDSGQWYVEEGSFSKSFDSYPPSPLGTDTISFYRKNNCCSHKIRIYIDGNLVLNQIYSATGYYWVSESFEISSLSAGSHNWRIEQTRGTYYCSGYFIGIKAVNIGYYADYGAPLINSVTQSSPACEVVRFTVSATDYGDPYHQFTGSGIDKYSFDGGSSWQTANYKDYSGTSKTITAGNIKVRDNAGNVATYNQNVSGTAEPCGDVTPPTISSVTPSSPACEVIRFTVSASDSGSGLHSTAPYSFDGGTNWQADNYKDYSGTSKTITVGNIKVRDDAGNIATYNQNVSGTAEECGDVTPPIILRVLSSSPYCEVVRFTVSAKDEIGGSGLHDSAPYSFNEGETWQASSYKDYSGTSKTITAGKIKVRDNANNITTYNQNISGTAEVCSVCGDNSQCSEGDGSSGSCCNVWGLTSGDSSSGCWFNMCCGDDSAENYKECFTWSQFHPLAVVWGCSSGDDACCDKNSSCVKNGQCYGGERYGGGGYQLHSNMNPGGNDDIVTCDEGGWYDCDEDPGRCGQDPVSTCGSSQGVEAGESGVGEYDAQGGTPHCCGDDANEYLISSSRFCTGYSGPAKCCNNVNDYINASGNCVSSCPSPNNPPYVPSNPSPTNGATCISRNPTLSWTGGDPDSGDSITYTIYFCSGSGCEPTYLTSTANTSHSLSSLGLDTLYRWQIVADDGQYQTAGPIWSFTVNEIPPAPSNLIFTEVGADFVSFEWTDNSSNETGFNIYRDWFGSTWAWQPANDTDFTDENSVECNKQYLYGVSAVNSCGESTYLEGEVTTLPCSGLGPDLIIEDIYWSPATPYVGQQVDFTVTIKNQGTSGSGSSITKYYINGEFIDQDGNIGIGPDDSKEETFSWTATGCGLSHNVQAIADADDNVDESNEGNNERVEVLSFINSAPNAPSLSGPTEGEIGVSYDFTAQAADPNCDDVRYSFDWDDETSYTTGYVSSGVAQTASKSWENVGIYDVCVMAADSSEWSSPTCQTINITSGGLPENQDPTADFSFCLEEGTERTVRFIDESDDSDGSIVSWDWDFHDGETCLPDCNESGFGGINQNPVHTFSEGGGGGGIWWDGSWQYRIKVIFNNSSRGVLIDVPVTIKLSSDNFDFSHAKSDGADVRFIDSDNSTVLNYEIESWSQLGQTANFWVKVPQIDAGSATDHIYMYYGNSVASDSQNPTGVWDSNFVAVYHMSETSGDYLMDSTANSFDAVEEVGWLNGVTGKIDGAIGFYGGNAYNVDDHADSAPKASGTVELWFKRGWPDELWIDKGLVWVGESNIYSCNYFIIETETWYDPTHWRFTLCAGGWWNAAEFDLSLCSQGSWCYQTMAWTAFDRIRAYVNSNFVGSDRVGLITATFDRWLIGQRHNEWTSRAVGTMDELRFSDVERSPDWISLQYCSMNQSCLTYESEETSAGLAFVSLTVSDDDGGDDSITKQVDFATIEQCPANSPPQASDFSVSQGDYCTTPSHNFSWTYSDPDLDTESKFQFQVDNNSDFSSPEVDRTYDGLSYPSDTINSQVVLVSPTPEDDKISYNVAYHWRVKVWDSQSNDSGWLAGPDFSTEEHQYPLVDFSWDPQYPAIDETVKFSDDSQTYGGSSVSSRSWTFTDGTPSSSSQKKPQVIFGSGGEKAVNLIIIDSDGYSCPSEKNVRVGSALPEWQEVEP